MGLGLTLGLAPGDGLTVGLGLADGDGHGVAVGARRVVLGALTALGPLTSRASGTTTIPMRTVTTKAAAPHSRRQKAQDQLRIRGRRPAPAAACYGC